MHLNYLLGLVDIWLMLFGTMQPLRVLMTWVCHLCPLRPASYCDMAHMKINAADQPRLNDRETTALQSHVEDWEKASGTGRRQIFKAAAREARILAPKMDQELLKQRKEKYRQWFHNHKKHKANAKVPIKLQKKWTARQVIEEQRKADILQQIHEEIEEETGQKPGQKEVFRRYQPTMMAIMKGLDKNELEEAQAKADEWTNRAPDAAVQAKTAKKKGEKMVKHFAKEMFTQAGMRRAACLPPGKLFWSTGRFDFNEHLGRGSSFMKCKDWQVILPAWEDYIGDEFNQDQDQDGTLLGGTRRVPKPYYEFDLDRMGLPMLPDIEGASLETKKGMIWSFLTIHYRICCGKLKVPVPWSDIMKGQSRFISSLYLPDNTKLTDPSKLQRDEADTLLECWLARQDTQVGPTLKFKAWIDDKGKMHPPVSEESQESDGDADDEGMWPRPTKTSSATTALPLFGITEHQPRFIKRVHISSADEASDNTDADLSHPKVNVHTHNHARKGANARYSEHMGRQSDSDDWPPPKILGKRVRIEPAIVAPSTDSANEDRLMLGLARQVGRDQKAIVSGETRMPTAQETEGSDDASVGHAAAKARYKSTRAHAGQKACGFGPHSTCQGLEHIRTSTTGRDQPPSKTGATEDASLVVGHQPLKKTKATRYVSPAVNNRSPNKTQAARSAARLLSDAPAKSTRSKVDNALGARIRHKPKRYADYV
ncbi:hypothetical protein EV424DRAFT_1351885 [Suillus variegatus]|nr:hypothetical protein EV424DRAFT_1351885 [Suillus variegatus]